MPPEKRSPRYVASANYGPLEMLVGDAKRKIMAQLVDESDAGLGFKCLSGEPPQKGDPVVLNQEHRLTVQWSKKVGDDSFFGVKL